MINIVTDLSYGKWAVFFGENFYDDQLHSFIYSSVILMKQLTGCYLKYDWQLIEKSALYEIFHVWHSFLPLTLDSQREILIFTY